jgi:hypothetical protein
MIATLLKRSIGRKPRNPWIIWALRYGDLGSAVLGQGSDRAGQNPPARRKTYSGSSPNPMALVRGTFHAVPVLPRSAWATPFPVQTGLEEAVTAFRAALKEYTPERVPLQWAMTAPCSEAGPSAFLDLSASFSATSTCDRIRSGSLRGVPARKTSHENPNCCDASTNSSLLWTIPQIRLTSRVVTSSCDPPSPL